MADETIIGNVTMDTDDESFIIDDNYDTRPIPTKRTPTRLNRLSLYDRQSLASSKTNSSSRRCFSAIRKPTKPDITMEVSVSNNLLNEMDFTKFVNALTPKKLDQTKKSMFNNISMDISSASLASFEQHEKSLLRDENSFVEERMPSFIHSGTPVKRTKRLSLHKSLNRDSFQRSLRKSPRTRQLFNSILNESEKESRLSQERNDPKCSYPSEMQQDEEKRLENITIDEILNISCMSDSFDLRDVMKMDDSSSIRNDSFHNSDLDKIKRLDIMDIMVQVADKDPDLSINVSSQSIHLSPINSSLKRGNTDVSLFTAETSQILDKSNKKSVTFQVNHLSKTIGPQKDSLKQAYQHHSTPLHLPIIQNRRLFDDKKEKIVILEDKEDEENDEEDVLEQVTDHEKDEHVSQTQDGSCQPTRSISRKLFPDISSNLVANQDSEMHDISSTSRLESPDDDPETNVDHGLKTPNSDTNKKETREVFKQDRRSPEADFETNVDFALKQLLKTPKNDANKNETIYATREIFKQGPRSPEADLETNVDFGLKQLLKTPKNAANPNETVYATREIFGERAKSPQADYEANVDFGLKQILKTPEDSANRNETVYTTREVFGERQKTPQADYETNVDFGLKQILTTPKNCSNSNETIYAPKKLFDEDQSLLEDESEPKVPNETIVISRNMFREPQKSPKSDYITNVDFGLKNLLKTPQRNLASTPIPVKNIFQPKTPEADYSKFVDWGLRRLIQRSSRSRSPAIDTESDDEGCLDCLFVQPSSRISIRPRLEELLKSPEAQSHHMIVDSVSEAENGEDDLVDLDTQPQAQLHAQPQAQLNPVETVPAESTPEAEGLDAPECLVENAIVDNTVSSLPMETFSTTYNDETTVQLPEAESANDTVRSIYFRTRSGQKAITNQTFKVSESLVAGCKNLNNIITLKRQKSLLRLSSFVNSSSSKKASSRAAKDNFQKEHLTTPQPKSVKSTILEAQISELVAPFPDVVSDSEPPKQTRGKERSKDEGYAVSPPQKTVRASGKGKKAAPKRNASTSPVRKTRGRKKVIEDDLAELAGFHQEVNDARLDQLIMDAADGNIETAPRGGKGKTAALSTRNRKRKIDSEEDEKLTAVVGSTGDCNVQILEEFIDDENNKKAAAKIKTTTKRAAAKRAAAKVTKQSKDNDNAKIEVEKPKRTRKKKDDTEPAETESKPKAKRTIKSRTKDDEESHAEEEPKETKPKRATRGKNSKTQTSTEPEHDGELREEPAKPKVRRATRTKKDDAVAKNDETEEEPTKPKARRAVKTKKDDGGETKDKKTEAESKPKRAAKKRSATTDADAGEPEIKTTRTLRARK